MDLNQNKCKIFILSYRPSTYNMCNIAIRMFEYLNKIQS